MISVLFAFALMLPIFAHQHTQAHTTSGWVLASSAPSGAEIVDRKWTYTKTTYLDSKTANLSGYTLKSSEWVKSGSGSKNWATFPSGYDTSNSIYTSFAKSQPYTASETTTSKRAVSNTDAGYVYWHWAYNAAYYNTTKRAISSKKLTKGTDGYAYIYFYAFTSATSYAYLDNYYCNSQNLPSYNCSAQFTSYVGKNVTGLCTPRFFRFSYKTCTYTDYYKLFHYTKTENLESTTAVSASSSSTQVISNVKAYVKYKSAFSVSYNANGGSGAPSAQTKSYGAALTLSSTKPTRTGYVFLGWSTNKSATAATYAAGGSFTSEADTTLYAVWTKPSGMCGTSATWGYDPTTGTLTISGTGAMANYEKSSAVPWSSYNTGIKTVVVAEGICSIGAYAFSGCTALTSVQLPSSLTSMGRCAFDTCTALKSISIPAGVTEIPDNAFYHCYALEAVGIPATITTIGESAFQGCIALGKITLPNAVQMIDNYAFSGCTALKSFDVPSGLNRLSQGLFCGCTSLTEFTVPSTIQQIDSCAFQACTVLQYITIPEETKSLGEKVFEGDTALTVRCYIDSAAYDYAEAGGIAMILICKDQVAVPVVTLHDSRGNMTLTIEAVEGAKVHYTVDGSDPTEESELYVEPIVVSRAMTLKAFCVKEGYKNSDILTYEASGQRVDTPTADVASGSKIAATARIALSCDTEGAELWYSVDGYDPEIGGTGSYLYTDPIALNMPGQQAELRVIAYKDGWAPSSCASFLYNISEDISVPKINYLTQDVGAEYTTVNALIESKDDILQIEVCWYALANSKEQWSVSIDPDGNCVNLSQDIKNLDPDTDYCYFVKARNYAGWGVGASQVFTTMSKEEVQPWVMLDQTYLQLRKGRSRTLLATVLPKSANSWVCWTSDDPDIADVDDNGKITAKSIGRTTVHARLYSGAEAQCVIQVLTSAPVGAYDFSEGHMITASSNLNASTGTDLGVTDGGNALMATAYLSRWDGAVLEEDCPYPEDGFAATLAQRYSDSNWSQAEADKHVQGVIFLPNRNGPLDNHDIKAAIMKYGAVYTSFYENSAYYNGSSYYYPNDVLRDGGFHAVAIVGWDDNWLANNFKPNPAEKGAFICKNSRGTAELDNGYFYVSYYDASFGKGLGNDYNAVFYNLQSGNNYNKIYQYDLLGATQLYDVNSSHVYMANVFPEPGETLEHDEVLKAVSFYNYAPGTAYKVYVVTDYQGPDSLLNLGQPVAQGSRAYTSYDTVELREGVSLDAGTRFAVVVELEGDKQVFMETPSEYYSRAIAHADESYLKTDSGAWIDVAESISDNSNLCVKAFTQLGTSYGTLFGIDDASQLAPVTAAWRSDDEGQAELLAWSSESSSTGALSAIIIPDLNEKSHSADGVRLPARYSLLDSDQNGVTSVKDQGKIPGCWSFAAYASLESAIMRLSETASSNSGLSGAASDITLNKNACDLTVGESVQLLATMEPYGSTEQIYWFCEDNDEDNDVVTVTTRGFVTAQKPGVAIVTARTADGRIYDTCTVTALAAEPLQDASIRNTQRTVKLGSSLLMEAETVPANADKSELIWTTSDPAIAEIDGYGYLTASSYGPVTVTLSSADGQIYDSYTLLSDDGRLYSAEIAENNLHMEESGFSGDLSLAMYNFTETAADIKICLAFYTRDGRFLHSVLRETSVDAGDTQMDFGNIQLSSSPEDGLLLKVILLAPDSLAPLAPSTKIVLR